MGFPTPDPNITSFRSATGLAPAYIRATRFQEWFLADSVAYACRFNHIFTELRDDSLQDGNECNRPYKNDTFAQYSQRRVMLRIPSLVTMVPDPLPGSDNKAVSSGATLQNRGGLRVAVNGNNIEAYFTIREVTLDGTGGLSSAGTEGNVTLTCGAGSYTWDEDYLLYPTGVVPGSLVEITLKWKQDGTGGPGYLAGVIIAEPELFALTPQ